MNCPVCTTTSLVMTERAGVEIDYCPQCRGVWLDRGELDKILERAAASTPAPAPAPAPAAPAYPQPAPPRYEERRYEKRYDDDDRHYGYKKKKSSWLSEIFD